MSEPENAHADWARAVAKEQNVGLVDLQHLLAQKYDALGKDATTALYADGHVHTTRAGAELTAKVVVDALQALPDHPVANLLREKPAATW